jgi:tetratricopeptide (TPR) repeat protein
MAGGRHTAMTEQDQDAIRTRAADLVRQGNDALAVGDYDEALWFFNEANNEYAKIGFQMGEAISSANIGNVYKERGDHEQALRHLTHALALNRELGREQGAALSLSNIGQVYENLGNDKAALQNFNESLLIARKLQLTEGIAIGLGNIARLQLRAGDAARALRSYEASYAEYTKAWIATHDLRNEQALSQCLSGMAHAHMELGHYGIARQFFERALDVARKLNQQPMVASSLRDIANVYSREGKSREALGKYREALLIFQRLGLKKDVAICEHNIGVIERTGPRPG